MPRRRTIRDALTETSPMLLGVVPFGLVAGAAPIAAGLDPEILWRRLRASMPSDGKSTFTTEKIVWYRLERESSTSVSCTKNRALKRPVWSSIWS